MSGDIHILVVDDNALDRELVRRLLPQGFPISEAATGEEARAHIAAAQPDLVLLDNRLPDVNGIDLLPLFAERYIPVVMLTEIEAPEIVVAAMQRGAQDYLVKNALSREGLRRAIRNALEKAALRRTLHEQQQALAEQARVLEARNHDIRALASSLTLAEQAERHRIAALLHDHVQQLLLGARLRLQMLRTSSPEEVVGLIGEMNDILQEALESTRTLAIELTPPALDDEHLEESLQWLAEHMGRQYHFTVRVEAETSGRIPSRDLRVLLLQLVRELVFNVIKHAGANEATIRLKDESEGIMIIVEDQGRGFDVAALQEKLSGFGLYSVRERLNLLGGRLEIASSEGSGTRMTIVAPMVEPVIHAASYE